MKNLNFVMFCLLCLLFWSCNKDDETVPMEITSETLQQTWWQGTFTERANRGGKTHSIELVFETKSVGLCSPEAKNTDSNPWYYFDYNIEAKLISISIRSSNCQLNISGDWWIASSDEKQQTFVLKRDPYVSGGGDTLILIKKEII